MNNKVALMRFLDDGHIEMSTAANIYSLIETDKLNNINPWQYLDKVLRTIQLHRALTK